MTYDEKVKEYDEKVKNVADARVNEEPIYNNNPESAAILISHLFRVARKQVCILCGNINEEIYGQERVIEAVKNFISDKSQKLKIIIEEPSKINSSDKGSDHKHPLLKLINSKNNVEIKQWDNETNKIGKHFALCDDDCFRFEADVNKTEAIGCFGDKKNGKILGDAFDRFWKNSVKYTP